MLGRPQVAKKNPKEKDFKMEVGCVCYRSKNWKIDLIDFENVGNH